MTVLMADVISAMNDMAPQALAESWDNPGLACGHPGQEVHKVWLALTPTMDVLTRARNKGCDAIITHHPLIFKPLASLAETASPARELAYLIRGQMALFSAHTNLDICQGGVNDVLAEHLGLTDLKPLTVERVEGFYKLRVFVPETHLEVVKKALFAAGAGAQGDYDRCAWQVLGEGQFRPREQAQPFLGRAGHVSSVAEHCLEVLVSEPHLADVCAALKKAHPYEEVAYDIFREEKQGKALGLGRIGQLPSAVSLETFSVQVAKNLKAAVRTSPDRERLIQRVAVCGGAASGYLAQAKAAGADCYVTGDLSYHDFQKAMELDIALIDGTHFATERPVLSAVRDHLQNCFGDQVDIMIDAQEKDQFM